MTPDCRRSGDNHQNSYARNHVDLTPSGRHTATLKASIAMHPLGRIGEPSDVASLIVWLLDPAHGWVTGQVMSVDGGLGTLRSRG